MFIITSKKELKVCTTNGYLIISNLKLAGKRKMDANSLLNGFVFEDKDLYTLEKTYTVKVDTAITIKTVNGKMNSNACEL